MWRLFSVRQTFKDGPKTGDPQAGITDGGSWCWCSWCLARGNDCFLYPRIESIIPCFHSSTVSPFAWSVDDDQIFAFGETTKALSYVPPCHRQYFLCLWCLSYDPLPTPSLFLLLTRIISQLRSARRQYRSAIAQVMQPEEWIANLNNTLRTSTTHSLMFRLQVCSHPHHLSIFSNVP